MIQPPQASSGREGDRTRRGQSWGSNTTDPYQQATSHTARIPLRGLPAFVDGELKILAMDGSRGALVVWSTQNAGWRYLRCSHGGIMVNGQPLALDWDHDGTVVSGRTVLEHLSANVDRSWIEGMASAGDVRVMVCNDEVRISSEDRAQLPVLLSRWQAPPPPVAPAASPPPAAPPHAAPSPEQPSEDPPPREGGPESPAHGL